MCNGRRNNIIIMIILSSLAYQSINVMVGLHAGVVPVGIGSNSYNGLFWYSGVNGLKIIHSHRIA